MIKKLLDYVEIRTKITSLFTFLYTLGILIFWGVPIPILPVVVFFSGMFLFDLTTTCINNYIDEPGQIVCGFKRSTAFKIVMLFLLSSILLGLFLVYITNILVLFVGCICFLAGVLYTYGPIPISRQPYGEIVSGLMFGYCIPLILFIIVLQDHFIEFTAQDFLVLRVNLLYAGKLLVLGGIPACMTASLMLANNICDLDKDILVKRYTLPYYIGKAMGIKILYILHVLTFVFWVVGVMIHNLPVITLMGILGWIKIYPNLKQFKQNPIKQIGFPLIVKSYIIVFSLLVISLYLGVIIR